MPPASRKVAPDGFGAKLKDFRRRIGWKSQKRMADYLGYKSQQNVSLIETGEQAPTLEALSRLAELAGSMGLDADRSFFLGVMRDHLTQLGVRPEDLYPQRNRGARRRQ